MEPRTKAGTGVPRVAETRLEREAVARRAYALYEARGHTPGHEDEDWLEAERQLREEQTAPLAAPALSAKAPRPRTSKAARSRDGKTPRPPEAEA